jgi:hypothetical protein
MFTFQLRIIKQPVLIMVLYHISTLRREILIFVKQPPFDVDWKY